MIEYVEKIATAVQAGQPKVSADVMSRYYNDLHIVNKPFFFKGTNDHAVLLLHGWTSTPYEMRALGERLNRDGYTVYAPLLSGHGTKPEHLENVAWEEWLHDAEDAYRDLRSQYSKVSVGGMSMGGSLTLHVAKKYSDVTSIILMGTPYRLRYQFFAHAAASAMIKFKKYKKKTYPRIVGTPPGMTQLISYQKYPIASAFQAGDAITASTQKLYHIKQPCLLLQSNRDHLVTRDSSAQIHERIRSRHKYIKTVKNAYHNFIGDTQHFYIHDDILRFLRTTRV